MKQLSPNEEKIVNFLTKYDKEMPVTDLASNVQIDVKNIGRYLKQLQEKNFISIRIEQQGKQRIKHVSHKSKKEDSDQKEGIDNIFNNIQNEIKDKQNRLLDLINSGLTSDTPEYAKIKPNDIKEINEIDLPQNPPKSKIRRGSLSQKERNPPEIKNLDPVKIIESIQKQNSIAYSNVTKQLKKFGKKVIIYEIVSFINNNKEKFWI